MISWILFVNPVIDLAELDEAMIYFHQMLPWCLILTGVYLQYKPKRTHKQR
ncbi:MAG: hypothetical protein J6K75_02730 [Erysipelotrichaceae bacterium]|nr:hypothetical protein [Erysipelotrichaceae bacterium]MBQ7888784.1 hypothetical protein [Erysipelotrichaceae bacterium]